MSEYKRFTQNVDSGFVDELDCRIAYNKLCAIEDKIENGTLIEFPCKVGDTVYLPWVWAYDGPSGIAFSEVTRFRIYEGGAPSVLAEVEDWGSDMNIPRYFMKEHFGNHIFLTKAEAEAKLKELKGEV